MTSHPRVYISKYQKRLTPDLPIKGSQLAWQIGDKAIYTAPKSGKKYNVVIDSQIMRHEGAPGLVYEAIFEDGQRAAVLADGLEPIFSEKELVEIKECLGI